MAVQQRRGSKHRKAKRRTHYKLSRPAIGKCPNCGEYKLSHKVCPSCGFYKGRQVVVVENND
ncbi:50S ribosomal protein L32 [Erysipelotrichaceae bacterium 51-3]|uniref:50S ribosomal protein L32 n=1 Tax=Allobaculum sp. JKK-2023 TaxID=3108943 RepID=UPI002B05F15C|nr:50S ribosomal protein L32 [Allobaculum sp. JKK-2023]